MPQTFSLACLILFMQQNKLNESKCSLNALYWDEKDVSVLKDLGLFMNDRAFSFC